jgi:hypothetical protein
LYDTSESIYCLTKDRLMYGYPDDDPGEEWTIQEFFYVLM